MDKIGITRELDELIALQIHTLKKNAAISDPELEEYRQRSQRIRNLWRTQNQGSSQAWLANQTAQS